MAERGSDPSGGGLHRADPRCDDDVDRLPVAPRFAVDELEDQRGEAVDASIARGDQRDAASGGGKVEGEPRALLLRADRARMAALALDRPAEEIEVEAVANDILGGGDEGARLGGAPGRVAG